MKIDIKRVRTETKHCDEVVYFNSADSSLPPDCAVDAVVSHLRLKQKVGGYRVEEIARGMISSFYDLFAQLLDCRSQGDSPRRECNSSLGQGFLLDTVQTRRWYSYCSGRVCK